MEKENIVNNIISRRSVVAAGMGLAGGLLLGPAEAARNRRVLVWSEGTAPKNVYPNDINAAIAEGLQPLKGWDVATASIAETDQGLSEATLNGADVLIWWGHQKHGDVANALVDRIVKRVREDGMGFIATHSAHYSKPLKALLGTNCGWKYYTDDGASVELVVKAPSHPIARGIKNFTLPHTERYGDPFEVPTAGTVVFDGIYTLPSGAAEHAQQGMVWTVGKGRVFYFQPGHESYPIYFNEDIRHIFRNGVQWCAGRKK